MGDNSTQQVTLSGLARQLVNQGLVSEEAAQQAVENSSNGKLPLISALVEQSDLTTCDIAQAIAADFGLPCYDLSGIEASSIPEDLISEDLIANHNAVPIARRGTKLFIAISDPTNSEPLDKYKFTSGLSVEAVVVEEDKLQDLKARVLEGNSALSEGLDDSFDLEVDSGSAEADGEEEGSEVDETPVVRFVNKVLLDAIKRGASDIHVEPYEKEFRIRFRIDGILEEVVNPPLNMSCLLYTSPSPRDKRQSRMPSSA